MFFLFSLCKYFLQRKLLGHKAPLLASFKLTYRCNLACRACPFHREEYRNIQMDWHTACRSLAILKKLNTQIVVFEGGEPLLWQDGSHGLTDLIRHAKTLFPRVAITTNGTIPFAVPADIIWVSLDGMEDTHDHLRSNSFKKTWNNLRNSDHPNVLIHMTLNRENWRDARRLLEKISGLPSARGVTVQFFYPYGKGEENLALPPEARQQAIEDVIKMKRQGFPILNSVKSLKGMILNTWTCHDDVLINVDPDGSISEGCYAKRRGNISCKDCGFTPVAEASGAIDLSPSSLYAGWSIFLRK